MASLTSEATRQCEWTPSYQSSTVPQVGVAKPLGVPVDHDTRSIAHGKSGPKFLKKLRNLIPREAQIATSPLCEQCHAFISGPRPTLKYINSPKHPFMQNLDQMLQASENGCHLCYIRRSQLSDTDLARISRGADIEAGYWEGPFGNNIQYEYPLIDSDGSPLERVVTLVSPDAFLNSQTFLPQRRNEVFKGHPGDVQKQDLRAPCHMNSPSSIATIAHWLRRCNEIHENCRELRESRARPSFRVIDIGIGETIRPVVRESQDLPALFEYVTLSHCWGHKQFLRLLKANKAILGRAMPVTELSQTFRDAMEVTRRLSLRFLWIDSLCIIQDSERDWREQSALMGDIYQNAYCNLAATAAKDGSNGLFQMRKLLDTAPCVIQPKWFGIHRPKLYCNSLGGWERAVDKSPLLSRAWVAQEVVLAPRVVHFAKTEIFWECSESRGCETYPDGIPNFKLMKIDLHIPRTQPHKGARLSTSDGSFPAHEIWGEVVGRYTRANLTFPVKDKLVAIGGVAARLPFQANDYLAGLWRPGLTEQLLWHVGPGNSNAVGAKSTTYIAPSWSWASKSGPVLAMTPQLRDEQNCCVRILAAAAPAVDASAPYGRVENGLLRLDCVLAYLQYTRRQVEMKTTYQHEGGQLREVALPPHLSTYQVFSYLGEARAYPRFDDRDTEPGHFYYCILFYTTPVPRGLMVQPTGQRNGEYARIGTFVTMQGSEPPSARHFLQACLDFETATHGNAALYHRKGQVDPHGFQHYEISLV